MTVKLLKIIIDRLSKGICQKRFGVVEMPVLQTGHGYILLFLGYTA